MGSLILSNTGFWVNIVAILLIAVIIYLKTKEFSPKEFLIQIGVTSVLVFISFNVFFSFNKDLVREEIWGGTAQSFIKEEGYEEEYDCSYEKCDSDGKNCRTISKTCERWISEKRYINTSNKTKLSLSKQEFYNASRLFPTIEKKVYRASQTYQSKLKGEGDIWISTPNTKVWTSEYHTYENLVSASKYTIQRRQTHSEKEAKIKKEVLPYPVITYTKLGKFDFDRFIGSASLNADIRKSYKKELKILAGVLGKTKQINPMIYVTNTDDIKFIDKLEIAWRKGNKNDSILILHVDSSFKIKHTDVLSWAKDVAYNENLKKSMMGKNLSNVKEIISIYENEIKSTWVRKPMSEYDYLKGDISLPMTYQLLIIFINTLANIGLYYYFLRNRERRS